MKQKLALVLIFLTTLLGKVFAQDSTKLTGTISGTIKDTSYMQSMRGAHISIYRFNDTVPLKTIAAVDGGQYAFTKLPLDSFWVKVSYTGYATMKQKAYLSTAFPTQELKTFYMQPSDNELEEVVVVSAPPIKMNGDTMDLNAAAFHTKPNATAEDLLKKLPGVQVDASGNIQAQGETVSRVLVNGKRFFGSDPKMATQNLPKDIVEKIQIYDAQSDQSKFSGFDDGNRTKTINIIIKEEDNKGYFGKMTAGAGQGNQTNYNVGGNINKFNNEEKISLLGQVNNVNSQMFTAQDLSGGNGRGGGGGRGGGASGTFGGGNSGITKTIGAGIRYANKFGKTDVEGTYFYNNMRTVNKSLSERQNLYSDTSKNTNQTDTTNTLTRSYNHRFDFNIESELDSSNQLIVRPNISIIGNDNQSGEVTDIFRNQNGVRNYVTKSNITDNSHNSGYNGGVSSTYSHRFKKKGRTFTLGIDWTGNKNDGSEYSTNIIDYVSQGYTDSTNRYFKTKYNNNVLSENLSYTEPIAKYQQLELSYNHGYTKTTSDRTVYNFNNNNNAYTDLDSNLTNNFNNTYTTDRVSLGYHYNNSTINFSAGSGVQFGKFNSINLSKGYSINRNYTNLYPTASFRWNIQRGQRLMFNYTGRTAQPSAAQLQPVLDNSNQLSQTIGNADLKQSFTHSLIARYMFFDRKNYKHFFSMLNFSDVQNSIVNVTTQLASGGQKTSYLNMNGQYSLTGFFDYGFPISTPKSNFSIGANLSASKVPGMIVTESSSNVFDTALNQTKNYSFGTRLSWTTNLDSLFDINVSTTPNYTISKYSVRSSQNANYFSQSIIFEGTWYNKTGWQATGTFNYTINTGLYNTSIPLLNVSVSKYIFKNQAGQIQFSVHDLLNENKAVSNVRQTNYIQTTTNTVLRRYAMLSFIYNLKAFGKKGQGRDNDRFMGPPPGGGRMGPPPGGGGPGM